MGCVNERMVVVDTRAGRVVATLPIGRSSDAIAWDPIRRRVVSSNGGNGTVSIYQQVDADSYTAMAAIPTVRSARNMTVVPRTGRLMVVGADTDPNPAGGRPRVSPGTVRDDLYPWEGRVGLMRSRHMDAGRPGDRLAGWATAQTARLIGITRMRAPAKR